MATGFVKCIRTGAELALVAREKDRPDEALIIYSPDTAFKDSSPLEFVIKSYSVG